MKRELPERHRGLPWFIELVRDGKRFLSELIKIDDEFPIGAERKKVEREYELWLMLVRQEVLHSLVCCYSLVCPPCLH